MSVASELQDLQTYLGNAYSKINDKGGTIPQNKNMYNLSNAIDSIPTGSIIIIPPDAGTLTNLSITTNPTKMVYNEGEYFDFDGLVITATYSSGQQFDVTGSCTYTMNQPLLISDNNNVKATYEGLTVTILITVNAVPVPAPSTTTGLYHFNTSLLNEVSGNNAVAYYDTPSYGSGKFGQAVSGNIRLEPVSITTNNLLTSAYTFETWFKAGSIYDSLSDVIMREVDSSHTKGSFFVGTFQNITSQGVKMSTATGAGIYSFASTCTSDEIPSTFDISAFHHFAIVCNQGTYEVYLDGKLACHGNIADSYKSEIYAIITNYQAAGQKWDEMLICNSAKYSSNFVPNSAPYYIQ